MRASIPGAQTRIRRAKQRAIRSPGACGGGRQGGGGANIFSPRATAAGQLKLFKTDFWL